MILILAFVFFLMLALHFILNFKSLKNSNDIEQVSTQSGTDVSTSKGGMYTFFAVVVAFISYFIISSIFTASIGSLMVAFNGNLSGLAYSWLIKCLLSPLLAGFISFYISSTSFVTVDLRKISKSLLYLWIPVACVMIIAELMRISDGLISWGGFTLTLSYIISLFVGMFAGYRCLLSR